MIKRIFSSFRKLWINFNLLIRVEGYRRAAYIKKHDLFGAIGENVYFHPWKLPGDPKRIFIGNNVKIASEVLFINHDILHSVLNCKNKTDIYSYYIENIQIGDNVLIGSRSILLPNIKIGSNVVIGAGSVCSKDINDGCIVGGAPARVIGKFEELEQKRGKTNF